MSRGAMISLRRELIDKVTNFLQESQLFSGQLMFPRRYFDDLIMEQRIQEKNTQTLFDGTIRGIEPQKKLQEMIS